MPRDESGMLLEGDDDDDDDDEGVDGEPDSFYVAGV